MFEDYVFKIKVGNVEALEQKKDFKTAYKRDMAVYC